MIQTELFVRVLLMGINTHHSYIFHVDFSFMPEKSLTTPRSRFLDSLTRHIGTCHVETAQMVMEKHDYAHHIRIL
jgi:hypothetical protein